MAIIEKKKFIKTDASANNNKFWEYELHDDGKVICHWGRVGLDGERGEWQGGKSYVDKKVKEKEKKGYREIQVLDSISSSNLTKVSSSNLTNIAKKEIAGNCPVVSKLVEYLAKVNKHDIVTASGGKINVNLDTGIVSTPVGVVTLESINDARVKLTEISKYVKKKDLDNSNFLSNLNDYLMLVPQDVGMKRGWHLSFIKNDADLQKQNSLLDSLEVAVDSVMNQNKPVKDDKGDKAIQNIFKIKMSIGDDKLFDYLNDKYKSTRKDMHVCKGLKLKACYNVEIEHMKNSYDAGGAKMSNIKELWHGTKAFNVLSILKSGLRMPNPNSFNFCGARFGLGVYFASASTKSLNYSYGYWDGKYENKCFMFMADVALGNYCVPRGPTSSLPGPGYNSYWAQSAKSGVANDEFIIFNLNQCNLKYLLEFEA